MDLTDDLRGGFPGGSRQGEQAVIICLQFPPGKLEEQKARKAIADLNDILQILIATSGVGTYGGHEICILPEEESVTFYMYGEDASRIYDEIKPILAIFSKLPGSYIVKRFSSIIDDQLHLPS